MSLVAGIDLGGTKIDAQVFDTARDWQLIANHEIPTPRDDYGEMLAALAAQVSWTRAQGAKATGVGSPGLIRRHGGAVTANLPAMGKPMVADLADAAGALVPVLNDCRAFTLSEAVLGAGRGYRSVVGCVIGTGLAGGFALDGQVVDGPNGQAGEYGHTPLPHVCGAEHGLPVLTCGCGRVGCYETFCAGPGIARLSKILLGQEIPAHELVPGTPDAERVLPVWAEMMAQMLLSVCFTLDPDIIVLGGGVSNMKGVTERLSAALAPQLLPGTSPPLIKLAQGGDRSGARGAAIYALQQQGGTA